MSDEINKLETQKEIQMEGLLEERVTSSPGEETKERERVSDSNQTALSDQTQIPTNSNSNSTLPVTQDSNDADDDTAPVPHDENLNNVSNTETSASDANLPTEAESLNVDGVTETEPEAEADVDDNTDANANANTDTDPMGENVGASATDTTAASTQQTTEAPTEDFQEAPAAAGEAETEAEANLNPKFYVGVIIEKSTPASEEMNANPLPPAEEKDEDPGIMETTLNGTSAKQILNENENENENEKENIVMEEVSAGGEESHNDHQQQDQDQELQQPLIQQPPQGPVIVAPPSPIQVQVGVEAAAEAASAAAATATASTSTETGTVPTPTTATLEAASAVAVASAFADNSQTDVNLDINVNMNMDNIDVAAATAAASVNVTAAASGTSTTVKDTLRALTNTPMCTNPEDFDKKYPAEVLMHPPSDVPIETPDANDVLFGRGGLTNHHPGNKKYRHIIANHKSDYVKAAKIIKPRVARRIVYALRNANPPCRFLKKKTGDDHWYDVGDKAASEKTSQALREKTLEEKKKLNEKKLGDLLLSVATGYSMPVLGQDGTPLLPQCFPETGATVSQSGTVEVGMLAEGEASPDGFGLGIDGLPVAGQTIIPYPAEGGIFGAVNAEGDIVVTDNDTLLGRGGATNHHKGNKVFRNIVQKYRDEYVEAPKISKPDVSRKVVVIIRRANPPGRFLKKNTDGKWYDVGDKKATEKASQALREKSPEARKAKREKERLEVDSRRKEEGHISGTFELEQQHVPEEIPQIPVEIPQQVSDEALQLSTEIPQHTEFEGAEIGKRKVEEVDNDGNNSEQGDAKKVKIKTNVGESSENVIDNIGEIAV
mmetsp:Transcript_26511/g.40540  ORF Transcript_26511/g.40540 Transcript_26511/m.40540 type:complete len:834 (-) Transcript_26511:99-2600(-)